MYPHHLKTLTRADHDHEAFAAVMRGLHALETLAGRFHSALYLFDHSAALRELSRQVARGRFETEQELRDQRLTNRWPMLAAREGAFVLYDFSYALSNTKTAIREYPALNALVDWSYLKRARAIFKMGFPHWKKLRNAVGHTGEFAITKAQWNANSLKGSANVIGSSVGPGNHVTILNGRTYHDTTFGGDFLSYELSDESLARLWTIIAAVYESMDAASSKPMDERIATRVKLLRKFKG